MEQYLLRRRMSAQNGEARTQERQVSSRERILKDRSVLELEDLKAIKLAIVCLR